MRALVVGNRGDADPGLVGARLLDVGFSLDRNEREYPREWKSIAGIDLLLLLGSEWSVYWESNEKEVDAEVDLVRTAVERGVPIFAICFGAQVVAHAFGGTVSRSQHPEVGWHSVSSTLQPELLAHTWLQWHYDVFTVPPQLTSIATSDIGPQAMLGKRLFATQFHPEATTEIVTRWCSGAGALELAKLQLSVSKLINETMSLSSTMMSRTGNLVDWFLDTVASQ